MKNFITLLVAILVLCLLAGGDHKSSATKSKPQTLAQEIWQEDIVPLTVAKIESKNEIFTLMSEDGHEEFPITERFNKILLAWVGDRLTILRFDSSAQEVSMIISGSLISM